MKSHRPRKRFGQHFLHDATVIGRLVSAIRPLADEVLIEIGPGEGVLTGPLLEAGARITAIELDRDLAAALPERLGFPERLKVIQADVLEIDLTAVAGERVRVVGNLPYNISTPILFHLFRWRQAIVDMHFMLQKEVVDRLVAQPGSKQYGRLSVMAGFHCRMERLFSVPPEAFNPPPKVDSAIIRMRPKALDEAMLARLPALEKVVRHAFGQRRKTLRNALKGLLDEKQIESAGVDPKARAETLTLEQYLALTDQLSSQHANQPTS
ncbi:16S rRNA (adenine(1518)-N(6)/adenine(1519)-N(6))-dimethyltransferase RsmA [Wenzhouxiangella sp. XN201]|uniref:16S rRNA (adenine(1518)-N(6)/adenine(1519)-N(6))- dimethyltransferase RsmA n=1 Tax=Wenzhouxiangella sp. XN201 TaxID=2710755 RepID=UPI0013C8AF58|nr:16S rRNA (adenine(1518)-N(6)/adenine(1519)-N(6))-dimethyltransferase RsmA [Wenzhouxiangella sp. XN201]NEZ02836.1 16S rRNA (adenine(1518)-N(6)/adenine(1519)-N(6))-dimethyltransferase RsmA [Wenzhouxiangella sp. XN201]